MKFSTTEIKLCQDIAKKYRKEIKHYDEVIAKWKDGTIKIGRLFNKSVGIVDVGGNKKLYDYLYPDEIIPLWTLEDCLEFLRKKKWLFESLTQDDDYIWELKLLSPDRTEIISTKGKTEKEPYLKAILAVLEKGK